MGSNAADQLRDVVWTKAEYAPGRSTIPAFLAGTPVSVLAGFNFATAILIVSQRPEPDDWAPWANWGAGLLFVGAGMFLVVLALAGQAQFVSMTPDQAAAWWPEMALDKNHLAAVRDRVWTSQKRLKRLIFWSTLGWIVGLLLTAAGAAAGILSYGTTTGHVYAAIALTASMAIVALIYGFNIRGGRAVTAPALSPEATALMLRPQRLARSANATVADHPAADERSNPLRISISLIAVGLVFFGILVALRFG